jgi:hypothetical protein
MNNVDGFGVILMDEVKGYVNAQVMLEMLEQYQGCYFPHSTAVHIVNKLVQTNVAEVVRGRWIDQSFAMNGGVVRFCTSSECRQEMAFETNYCPSCGAKMDLEG